VMKLQLCGIACCTLLAAFGCDRLPKDTSKVIASVASEKITEKAFESTIKSLISDDAKVKDVLTNKAMRDNRNDFLAQLLKGKALVKLAKSQGLDKDPMVQTRLEQASAQAYLQVLIERRMPKTGPTDAELKALYDERITQLKSMGQDKGMTIPTFEQVKPQLPAAWKQQHETKLFEQVLNEATQKSPITYTDGYKPKTEK